MRELLRRLGREGVNETARLIPPLNTFSIERLKAAIWCSANIYLERNINAVLYGGITVWIDVNLGEHCCRRCLFLDSAKDSYAR